MFEKLLDYSTPEEAFLDKDLAKLGDTLVNLLYSLARSKAQGKPDGSKVPNEVLSKALNGSGLRSLAPSRMDRHRLGDIAEAVVAFAWLSGEITISESADILFEFLSDRDFGDRRDVLSGAEEGFKKLLTTISKRVSLGSDRVSRDKEGD